MEEKIYLCFWVGDGGDTESYNVYHSKMVFGNSKDDAVDKYMKYKKATFTRREYYDAIEIEIKDILK